MLAVVPCRIGMLVCEQDGIDIDATTWSQIVDTARSLGLAEDHWVAV